MYASCRSHPPWRFPSSQVLSKDLRKWDVAYDLIRDVARKALGKASTRLKDGEVTRVN